MWGWLRRRLQPIGLALLRAMVGGHDEIYFPAAAVRVHGLRSGLAAIVWGGDSMTIRTATRLDVEAITAIYNQVLEHSTAIYRDTPASLEERLAWFERLHEKGYPVLVAEAGGEVVGFASCSDFRSWPGYRLTVEGTIHLEPGARRKGTGTLLLEELILRTRALGKHMLIAGVDSENTASLQFLERAGFEQTAHLREVGYKFGRYLDLVLLQYRLG